MDGLFSAPGMVPMFVFFVAVQLLSLLLLGINCKMYRNQSTKYRTLLKTFGNEAAWGRPGRILLPAYVMLTIAASVTMAVLFIFQPHIL